MENKSVIVFNKKDFRKWLKRNHKKENKINLILHKKHTGKSSPSHKELMEEAICFGWIDTTVKKINDNKYIRRFSKRNQNSKWSENTLSYAKKLLDEGKMASQGLEFYNLGLKKPTHDHGIPKNPDIPKELKNQLKKNKKAKNNFEKFSPSKKRAIYRWILNAKLKETRDRRIILVINSAKLGKSIF